MSQFRYATNDVESIEVALSSTPDVCALSVKYREGGVLHEVRLFPISVADLRAAIEDPKPCWVPTASVPPGVRYWGD